MMGLLVNHYFFKILNTRIEKLGRQALSAVIQASTLFIVLKPQITSINQRREKELPFTRELVVINEFNLFSLHMIDYLNIILNDNE